MKIGILSIPSSRGGELRETKRLVSEIEAANHEAVVINYRKTAVSITERGRFLHTFGKEGKKLLPVEVDSVIPRIGAYPEAGRIALAFLMLNGVPSTSNPEAIEKAKDKVITQLILDKEGIPTPYSISPLGRLPEKPDILLKHIETDSKKPIIIKTRNGSHGKGVILATNRPSARSVVDSMDTDKGFLVQEFIEAPEKEHRHSDIRLVVVDGQVITSMFRQAGNEEDEDEFRSNLSLGGGELRMIHLQENVS